MKTITLELSKISLDAPLNRSGEALALATLVLPRPSIQHKTALKPFRLQKGKISFARKSFYEKALLKEKVDGPFGLTLRMTRPVAKPELQSWLRSMVGVGMEAAGDLFASGLPISALRPLLRSPFDELADQVSDDAPEFILRGGIDLDSENLNSGSLTIPLQLTEAIRQSDLPPGPKSREKRKASAKRYKKGQTIGEALLRVEVV